MANMTDAGVRSQMGRMSVADIREFAEHRREHGFLLEHVRWLHAVADRLQDTGAASLHDLGQEQFACAVAV